MESTYANKLEQVYQAFELSFDLDIAFTLVTLSKEEKESLEKDEILNARITLCIARERESLVKGLRALAYNAESESARLAAIKELGKTLYPKRFKGDSIDDLNKTLLKVNENLTANERLNEFNAIVAEVNKNKQVS
jgi:hypothetical protein